MSKGLIEWYTRLHVKWYGRVDKPSPKYISPVSDDKCVNVCVVKMSSINVITQLRTNQMSLEMRLLKSSKGVENPKNKGESFLLTGHSWTHTHSMVYRGDKLFYCIQQPFPTFDFWESLAWIGNTVSAWNATRYIFLIATVKAYEWDKCTVVCSFWNTSKKKKCWWKNYKFFAFNSTRCCREERRWRSGWLGKLNRRGERFHP